SRAQEPNLPDKRNYNKGISHSPMERKIRSRVLKTVLWTLGIFLLIGCIAQLLFARMVRKALDNELPENIHLAYLDLSTNVILGRIHLQEATLNAQKGNIDLKSKSVTASGLGYLALLKSGDLEFSDLEFIEPEMSFRQTKKDSSAPKVKKKEQKRVAIKTLSIDKGRLQVIEEKTGRPSLDIEKIDILLDRVTIPGEALPFSFEGLQLKTGEGFSDLGPLEILEWQELYLDSLKGHVNLLKFHTKYGKEELSKRLAKENDHYQLEVD